MNLEESLFSLEESSIPPVLERARDGAKITPLLGLPQLSSPPHGIGASYVTEGMILPAKVTRSYFVRGKWKNDQGIGQEQEETVTEKVPLVLCARADNGTAWLDVKPELTADDSLELDGQTRVFAKFADFEGVMDLKTLDGILAKLHVEKANPRETFELIRKEIRRILEVSEEVSAILALWIAGTYVHDAFPAYPYLWFNGIKGSGKTTGLEFMNETAYHAEMGMRISNPALFRDVDQHHCTICYDEAENLLVGSGGDRGVDQDRVSLFNSGYKSSGVVRLVEKDGDNFIVRKFSSYSPKALASIQPIDEALQSRCLLINMLVALDPTKGEQMINHKVCKQIRRDLYFFRFASGPRLFDDARNEEYNSELRKRYDLRNRDWELFKPLLMLAEYICPEWLDDMAMFIAGQKIIRRVDNTLSTDSIVLLKILEIVIEGENARDDAVTTVTYKDLMADLKDDYPELKWLTSKSIGNCLRRLGLSRLVSRSGKGYGLKLDKALVEEQVKRLGLEESAKQVELAAPAPKAKEGLDVFYESPS